MVDDWREVLLLFFAVVLIACVVSVWVNIVIGSLYLFVATVVVGFISGRIIMWLLNSIENEDD